MNVTATSSSLLTLLDEPVLRTIGSGPYPGEIIGLDDGPAVRVPAADPIADLHWAAGGEHVAAPRDLQLRHDGVTVLLPHCLARVRELVEQRRTEGEPLRAGEGVTLAVSILRGTVAEHTSHGNACRGSWWLTDDGTPLFVHEDGETDAAGAGAEALRACAAAAADHDPRAADAWEAAAVAVADPERLPSAVAGLEERLFGLAPPEPIRMVPRSRRGSRDRTVVVAEPPAERTAWRRLADAADAGVAELLSSALTDLWRALRRRTERPRPSRRGRVLLAAAAGALVLAVGLLWPAGEGVSPHPAPSEGRTSGTEGAADPESPAEDLPDQAEAPLAGEDTEGLIATATLLESLRACGDDADCRHGLQDHPAELSVHGAAFAAPDARVLTLLDDVGGLVLVRAEDSTGERVPQIVAVLRADEKWVLRDIHDVAQHPG